MKNRGVFSTSPRLPGMAHKTGGRPETLAGQITAPIEPRPQADIPAAGPEIREVCASGLSGEGAAQNPFIAAVPSTKRKYSLSLRIEAELVARFEWALESYPASEHASIRRGLATIVRERLAQDLHASHYRNPSQVPHNTVRLDLRLDPETVQALGRILDPYGLMPLTTMIARAVEPVYADVLRKLLSRADNTPT